MKRSIIISAIAVGIWYLVKEILGRQERTTLEPPKKHLTNAFAKAKEHANNAQV